MIVFLFVDGGHIQQNHRLIKDIWNAGHLVLFGLLSFSYFNITIKTSHTFIYKVIFTLTTSLFFGTAIEIFQYIVNRGFSYSDIINDVIGGYLGLLSIMLLSKQKTFTYRTIVSIIFIVFLVIGLRDFERHLIDEYNLRKEFPTLASFESKLELERWEFTRVNVNYSRQYFMSGQNSLEVEYLPGYYPNISLQYLKSDWFGYNKLAFTIYNPNYQELEFEIKVYDREHTVNGGKYNDRYNKKLAFNHGWNTIEISILDIINAPEQRSMDIHQIKSFSLFTEKLT